MGQIEIEQRSGQIGIQITQPNLNIKTTQPDLQLKTTPADLALQIEQPEVIIDLRASFNSMGLQDTYTFADSAAKEAKQACMRGIERRVSVGNQFTEPHGPSAGKIVAESSNPPEKQLVIGLMPSVPPDISAKMGTVKGTYTSAHINGKFNEGKVTSNFTWGRIDVYMEREPYINIKA